MEGSTKVWLRLKWFLVFQGWNIQWDLKYMTWLIGRTRQLISLDCPTTYVLQCCCLLKTTWIRIQWKMGMLITLGWQSWLNVIGGPLTCWCVRNLWSCDCVSKDYVFTKVKQAWHLPFLAILVRYSCLMWP